jgi:uncharacterized repeat protein (TIGR01451 family)
MRRALVLLLALPAAPALADALTMARTASVITDQVSVTNPKALPGSTVEYTITITNPNSVLAPVTKEVITEAIPAGTALRISDVGATGSGPVEFADGSLLGTGLLGSGLTFSYAGSNSTTDDLEFSNGTTWTYLPSPDANGFDPAVRAVRLTLHGTHVAGTRYRLRYRVKIL